MMSLVLVVGLVALAVSLWLTRRFHAARRARGR